jgi:Leucine-rich repeat (LRR) protein
LGKLANGLNSLTSLRDLTILRCRKLVCFSEGAGLPLSLKRLVISNCDSLRSLPDGMMTMVNDSNCNQCLLEELSVAACPSLKSLSKGKLPKTLKFLNISWDNQESLPEGILQRDARETSRSNLEHLTLHSLSATSFPSGEFPISLKELHIVNCRIPSLPSLHFLFHLTELRIVTCNELKSFPKGGLPLPNLISLFIHRCEKLRSLPTHMDSLKSLQDLSISDCHRLDSFTERGLPPNLTSLEIINCKISLPMSEWGLRMLTSLKRFSVKSTMDVDRFPDDEGLLLPTSLACLVIFNQENLKSISRGLQHLTSLEVLNIFECPILRFFPREGFPLSLGRIFIRDSPLLEERCLKEKGDYWSIIAHIPEVDIS